jgi:hypothetical protein
VLCASGLYLLSPRRACLSGALGFLPGEYLTVLCSCTLTDKLVSFFSCLTFKFERIPLPTPPPRWVPDPPLDPSIRWIHELLVISLWCRSTAVWGSYGYLLCVLEHVGRWETGELPVIFVRDGVQHAVRRSLTTSLGIQLFSLLLTAGSTFVHERFISTTPSRCRLVFSGTGRCEPSDNSGSDESTAVYWSL